MPQNADTTYTVHVAITGQPLAQHLSRYMAEQIVRIEADAGRNCYIEPDNEPNPYAGPAACTEPITEPTLRCLDCGRELTLDNFKKHAGTKRGYNTLCNECDSIYHAAKGFRVTERTFGVEIEFYSTHHRRSTVVTRLQHAGINVYDAGYSQRTSDCWKMVSDGSLDYNGMELVSPPLKGRAGLAELRKVCRVLKSCKATVNSSCGLHVHHDASDFTMPAWKSLIKLYGKHEADIDRLHPGSRSNGGYCRSLVSFCNNDINNLFERVDAAHTVSDLEGVFYTRYVKVNVDAFRQHGTVEMRQHAGTLNFDKMAAWVCLTQGMVEAAVKGARVSLKTKGGADKLYATVKAQPKVRKFFRDRAETLHPTTPATPEPTHYDPTW